MGICNSALFKNMERKKKSLQKGFWKCEKMFEDFSFLSNKPCKFVKCFKKDLI